MYSLFNNLDCYLLYIIFIHIQITFFIIILQSDEIEEMYIVSLYEKFSLMLSLWPKYKYISLFDIILKKTMELTMFTIFVNILW